MKSLTVEEILRGTGPGPAQSVGQMSVIPLLGEDDDTFAPPRLEVGTSGYGTLRVHNDTDRPTLVPTGAGWVVAHKAQDHALGGGALLRPGETRSIDTAMCIQQSQAGLISGAKHEMLILPGALRAEALSMRHVKDFRKLWQNIQAFNKEFGIDQSGGHLEFFLRRFQKELDEFVAEFEIVPRQVGAVVLIGGEVAGVERAPSHAFWRAIWGPLVRVCYGSLALAASRENKAPPSTRAPLKPTSGSLADLRGALAEAQAYEELAVLARMRSVKKRSLSVASEADDRLDAVTLTTVVDTGLAGQVATVGDEVRYASLCAAA